MVLLTGATGYLGSQLALEMIRRRMAFRVLLRQASRPVPGLLRSNHEALDATTGGCQAVAGDVCDVKSLAQACRGVRQVIHTAALVKTWVRDPREFRRVNLEGLQNLCQAAADAGVSRVIYTSSFIALGPNADANAAEGLTHRGPYSNEYEATKAQALDWLRREGFRAYPVIALLPGVIYGPGPETAGNLVGGMIKQYLAGRFPGLLGSGEQRWSFSFNEDVVAAHLAALDAGRLGEEYVLGGDNRSLNAFFLLLAELSGVRHPVRHLPFWLGKMVGALELARAKLTGRPPQLTPGVVEIFKHDWVYSSAKATAGLSYRVRPLEAGLAQTLGSNRDRNVP
jgi:NAD+-dependent farnesol dehydrogenase